MKWLCIILSVMTWVVESKNEVSSQGAPESCTAQYSCSYQKGTVRKDDVATLRLESLGAITIEQVEVYMRSNKSAGAGVLTLQVNGETKATKTGSFSDWTGGYDKDNFHPITLLAESIAGVNTMEITLQGTENSLYIEKYVITYEPAEVHVVTLMRGGEVWQVLTETQGGQGVLLPEMADSASWHHIGWSEEDFGTINTLPEKLHAASSRFYPTEDCSLWAVFEWKAPTGTGYITDLQSGVYMYVNCGLHIAMSGQPHDGVIDSAPVDAEDADLYYEIDFAGTDTVYITHALTGTPIGYTGTNMASVASSWLVMHEGEETLFYMQEGGKNYVLWLNIWDSKTQTTHAGLVQANLSTGTPMRLQSIETQTEEPTYTCHPEWTQGIEWPNEGRGDVMNEKARFLMHFGNYELIIENGQKKLIQR